MDPIKQEKRAFYKRVIHIGLPITLAQLLTSLLAFIDTIMVSSLGDNAISAVGIGANFYFLAFMINFGLISGLSIFFAQFWGNKNTKNVQKTFIVTIFASILLTTVFVVFGKFFPDFIVGLYNHIENPVNHQQVQEMGVNYIRIASIGYYFTAMSFVVIMLMRSMERVIFPQLVTFFTVILNTCLNYILINGAFGFPQMGIEGAATATVISSFTGMSILVLSVVFSKEEIFKIPLSLLKEIDLSFLKKLFSKALPVMFNETLWGLGMTSYLIAFTYINDNALATYHIANLIIGMFWVVNAGISSACAIMLGNKLGEEDIETAKLYGRRFVKLSFLFGVIMGVILFVLSPYIPLLFKDASSTVQHDATLILIVFAFYQPIKFTNAIHIIGTLRSGGDTKFALFAEVGALWGIGIPLAFILSIYTDLDIYVIVAIVNVEELIKFIFVNLRFRTYKWANNLT
jgi:putative MATE family efflux protein